MSDPFEDNRLRAAQYAEQHNLIIEKQLGFGNQGAVFSTDRQTAIKIHDRERFYQREQEAYLRLHDHKVSEICGCAVPRLVNCDDNLWVIEMTIVKPPYVLDFASSYLDIRPDYPLETIEEWRQEMQELFEDRWPDVQFILFQMERYGIYLYDVHPGNIRLST